MIKVGFDNDKYLKLQSQKIKERISLFGEKLYLELKCRGVLVRHFTKERIKDFNRITIGTDSEMDIFMSKVKEILQK